MTDFQDLEGQVLVDFKAPKAILAKDIEFLIPKLDTYFDCDGMERIVAVYAEPYSARSHRPVLLTGHPSCVGHVFGESCIKKWMSDHTTCPNCRFVLVCHKYKPHEAFEMTERYCRRLHGHWCDPKYGPPKLQTY